jgi:neutral ceramidase
VARRIISQTLKILLILAVLAMILIGRVDRTPLADQDFYKEQIAKPVNIVDRGIGQLKAGWAKVNITPLKPMPMAGYMPRDHFDTVHDSLYARILVIDNGSFRCAMINVDLLIFPPLLRDKLLQRIDSSTFLYLSASHTHNGVGGWDSSIGGRLITGSFSEDWVDDVAARIGSTIQAVTLKDARFQYWEADAAGLVENRVNVDSGQVDGKLRGVRLVRSDSSRATLFTFSAHATSIQKERLELSADYPGKVIELLEEKNNFAMFMSGMVGSHRFQFTPENNYEFIDKIAPDLTARIENGAYDSLVSSLHIRSLHEEINFNAPQLRFAKDWRVSSLVFNVLFNELKGELTYLELGNVIFIGTPCDFSGEIYTIDSLEQYAAAKGKHLIVTSFNGDYVGYITYDGHYDVSSKEEITTLNWVGPHFGEYFSDMIKKLIDHSL